MQNYFKTRKWHSSKYVEKQRPQARFSSDEPRKKKSFGQHFLRNKSVVVNMIDRVAQSCAGRTVLEIGCGDGFLTEQILARTKCKKLICLEIDREWSAVVTQKVSDPRLLVLNVNALDFPWTECLEPGEQMVLLANLPYNISIPILKKLRIYAEHFVEGVFMIQEEVGQKIVAQSGRDYGSFSLFLQHVFDFTLMQKIDPGSFCPPPKVDSRLVHFKPKSSRTPILDEEAFWKYIKACFSSPRRMLRNNISIYNFDETLVEQHIAGLRAQQMSFEQLLNFWLSVNQKKAD